MRRSAILWAKHIVPHRYFGYLVTGVMRQVELAYTMRNLVSLGILGRQG